ncbi:F-box/kelch-repeat protein At3g23880 [Medicago truncatula]|uniref:F-box/kelch-repeat protein At3g23880 n=1 Tax=Medicago truncatula TaxID=3880 RepID=UPI000D2F4376|nr:F-box/kelch-repeat protein At3g23880 [Medicago truncatula]
MGTLRSLFNSFHPSRLPDLPLELVAEILCRLPVKLLLQLRCLSKSFNTLISDPNFAKKHLRLSITRRNLILTYFDDTYDMKSTLIFYRLHSIFHPLRSIFNSVTVKPTQLHYPFDPLYNNIVGSCNGILCLDKKDSNIVKQSNVILWNPSIRKSKILPSFKIQGECGFVKYGFGYDHVNDVYKVVAVFSYYCGNEGFKTQGMVHTLGTNSWRMIHGELPLPRYRRLLQPNYGGEYVHKVNLGVLRDCLCILACSPRVYSVWLMKEYGNEESWIKLFRIPEKKGLIYYSYVKPLWISNNGQVLIDYASWRRTNLAVYDFKNGTFKKPLMQDFNGSMTYEVCSESLISPCF